jgi:hypothetical protein
LEYVCTESSPLSWSEFHRHYPLIMGGIFFEG